MSRVIHRPVVRPDRIRCASRDAYSHIVTPPKLRQFVRQALVAATGASAPDRAQLASAFDLRREQLRMRLRPLFGTTATNALFARALHLSIVEFPWLVTVLPKNREGCALDGTESVATLLSPQAFGEGLAAVLAHDIELLTTFIGDDFVMPMVQDAWGGARLAQGAARSEGDNE